MSTVPDLKFLNKSWIGPLQCTMGPSKHSGPIQEFAFRKQGSHFSKRTKSQDFPRFFFANFLAKLFFCLLLVTACCLWISQVLLLATQVWGLISHWPKADLRNLPTHPIHWQGMKEHNYSAHMLPHFEKMKKYIDNKWKYHFPDFFSVFQNRKFHDIFMIRKVADTFPGFQGAMVTLNK